MPVPCAPLISSPPSLTLPGRGAVVLHLPYRELFPAAERNCFHAGLFSGLSVGSVQVVNAELLAGHYYKPREAIK